MVASMPLQSGLANDTTEQQELLVASDLTQDHKGDVEGEVRRRSRTFEEVIRESVPDVVDDVTNVQSVNQAVEFSSFSPSTGCSQERVAQDSAGKMFVSGDVQSVSNAVELSPLSPDSESLEQVAEETAEKIAVQEGEENQDASNISEYIEYIRTVQAVESSLLAPTAGASPEQVAEDTTEKLGAEEVEENQDASNMSDPKTADPVADGNELCALQNVSEAGEHLGKTDEEEGACRSSDLTVSAGDAVTQADGEPVAQALEVTPCKAVESSLLSPNAGASPEQVAEDTTEKLGAEEVEENQDASNVSDLKTAHPVAHGNELCALQNVSETGEHLGKTDEEEGACRSADLTVSAGDAVTHADGEPVGQALEETPCTAVESSLLSPNAGASSEQVGEDTTEKLGAEEVEENRDASNMSDRKTADPAAQGNEYCALQNVTDAGEQLGKTDEEEGAFRLAGSTVSAGDAVTQADEEPVGQALDQTPCKAVESVFFTHSPNACASPVFFAEDTIEKMDAEEGEESQNASDMSDPKAADPVVQGSLLCAPQSVTEAEQQFRKTAEDEGVLRSAEASLSAGASTKKVDGESMGQALDEIPCREAAAVPEQHEHKKVTKATPKTKTRPASPSVSQARTSQKSPLPARPRKQQEHIDTTVTTASEEKKPSHPQPVARLHRQQRPASPGLGRDRAAKLSPTVAKSGLAAGENQQSVASVQKQQRPASPSMSRDRSAKLLPASSKMPAAVGEQQQRSVQAQRQQRPASPGLGRDRSAKVLPVSSKPVVAAGEVQQAPVQAQRQQRPASPGLRRDRVAKPAAANSKTAIAKEEHQPPAQVQRQQRPASPGLRHDRVAKPAPAVGDQRQQRPASPGLSRDRSSKALQAPSATSTAAAQVKSQPQTPRVADKRPPVVSHKVPSVSGCAEMNPTALRGRGGQGPRTPHQTVQHQAPVMRGGGGGRCEMQEPRKQSALHSKASPAKKKSPLNTENEPPSTHRENGISNGGSLGTKAGFTKVRPSSGSPKKVLQSKQRKEQGTHQNALQEKSAVTPRKSATKQLAAAKASVAVPSLASVQASGFLKDVSVLVLRISTQVCKRDAAALDVPPSGQRETQELRNEAVQEKAFSESMPSTEAMMEHCISAKDPCTDLSSSSPKSDPSSFLTDVTTVVLRIHTRVLSRVPFAGEDVEHAQ